MTAVMVNSNQHGGGFDLPEHPDPYANLKLPQTQSDLHQPQHHPHRYARKNVLKRVPFPLPKKLGSDRLLLVSKALDEIPQYRKGADILARRRPSSSPEERRVHFHSDNDDDTAKVQCTVHEYEKKYDWTDYADLWFSPREFAVIFDRDDEDFAFCFNDMQHTKQILQLWGMCSRATTTDEEVQKAAQTLLATGPLNNARGLESRIITGIRNHRQKAVQSFLKARQSSNSSIFSPSGSSQGDKESSICPRYLKFSQTAARFSQALAAGDAFVSQQQLQDEVAEDGDGSLQ